MCKIDDQCKLSAWSRAPKTDALGQPRGIGWRGLGGGSGWGVHMYNCGLLCKYNHKDNNASNMKFFISVLHIEQQLFTLNVFMAFLGIDF